MIAKPIPINWHPGLSIYASEPFLKSVGDEYGWIGGFDQGGKLRCILPYTVIRKVFFRMIRFRVETIPVGAPLEIHEEKLFLNSAIEYFHSIGADMIIPASNNTIFRTFPEGAVAAPYGSYIIDLSQTEEILWNNLHSKHRNVVRNAIKKGVVIRSGMEFMKVAYEMIRSTLKRSKMGFLSYYAFNRFVLTLNENIKIFIAEYQGTAQGCAVIPFSDYSAYYLYGGSIPNSVTGSMNLLQWEAIRQFRSVGVKHYDFVGVRIRPEYGSKQDGLRMFKQRFGGRLFQGYMWKYPIRPMKYFVYALAVHLLRGGDIVDAENNKMEYSSE